MHCDFIYICVRLFFGNVYSYDILNIYKVRSSISRLGLFLIWLLNTGLAKYLVFSASTVIITSLRSLIVKMFTLIFGCHLFKAFEAVPVWFGLVWFGLVLIFGCHLFKAFEAVPVRQQKNLSCGVRIDLGLELAGAKFHLKNIPFLLGNIFFNGKYRFYWKISFSLINIFFIGKYLCYWKISFLMANIFFY